MLILSVCYRFTALHFSSKEGHLAVTEYLLVVGADVNVTAEKQNTPLIVASGKGHLDTVKVLVGSGAAIEHRMEYG